MSSVTTSVPAVISPPAKLPTDLVLSAASRLPQSEVDYVVGFLESQGVKKPDPSRLRTQIVLNRLSVPVCNKCGLKGAARDNYRLCAKCLCTWWCTEGACR